MTPKDLIQSNPYRVLGVYVGTSAATESTNIALIKAYDEVDVPVDMPMRGDQELEPVVRNTTAVIQATHDLSLPRDRVRNALFWFAEGDEPWARLLNGAVSAVLANDMVMAMYHYGMLLRDTDYCLQLALAATHGLPMLSREDTQKCMTQWVEDIIPDISMFLDESADLKIEAMLSFSDFRNDLRAVMAGYKANTASDPRLMVENYMFVTQSILDFINQHSDQISVGGSMYHKALVQAAKAIYTSAKNVINDIGMYLWDNWVDERVTCRSPRTVEICQELMAEVYNMAVDSVERLNLSPADKTDTANAHNNLVSLYQSATTYISIDYRHSASTNVMYALMIVLFITTWIMVI